MAYTTIRKKLLKSLWIILLSMSYGLFTYYYFPGWWYSSIGTITILFFAYLFYGKEFLQITGLKINLKIAVKSILLAGLVVIASLLFIKYLAHKNSIRVEYNGIRNYYHDVFYTMNEEIVMGAIIISLFLKKTRIKPLYISLGLAVLFSIIHYIIYKWVFITRGDIHITTLTSLLLVGFVRNNLIIHTRHIGYSWALHFGWIAIMLGSRHLYIESNEWVTDPDKFNYYLGSYEMLIISIVLVLISSFVSRKRLLQKRDIPPS